MTVQTDVVDLRDEFAELEAGNCEDGGARAAYLLRWAADEIECLRAIVDKLPKTADGVPVVPGTRVWTSRAGGEPVWWADAVLVPAIPWSDYWSTREAAEAAAKGEYRCRVCR